MNTIEAKLEIKNPLGLHLRAALALAQTIRSFDATVTVSKGKEWVNASSITALLTLGAAKGTRLHVRAEGPEAKQAMAAVKELFESGFGEI